MTTRKQLWFLPIFLILAIFVVGCSTNHKGEIAEPINRAEWPTPVPTDIPDVPTPFPKTTLVPTATPTPRPADSTTPTPTAATEITSNTDLGALSGGNLNALAQQITALSGGLSPVAIAMVNVDKATIRQGPGASYGAVNTVERGNLSGVLGKNPGGDWLYVIDTSLSQGWLPLDVLRITGSLEGAPVLPPDPVAALIAQAISASTSGSSGSASAGSGATLQPLAVTDLEPVTTARVNNDVLNMRQRPGAVFKLLDTLSRDDEVTVLALNKDKQWALVETADGKQGWVSVDFLNIEGDLINAPQVKTLTPGADYPSDQVAPIVAMTGQSRATSSAPSAPATSSSVTTAAIADKPALPARVLAPVATGRINRKVDALRGPWASSGVLHTLHVDEEVSALAVNEQRDWVVVQADRSRVGWVPADSLTVEPGSLVNVHPVLTAWVKSNELAVLSGPGIYHETVGVLAINDLVAVLVQNEGGNWVLIETLSGGRGWISPKFLTMMGSLHDVPLITSVSFESLPTEEPAPAPTVPLRPAKDLIALQLSNGGDIMLIDADGSNLRRLTNGIDPILSPDGQIVAFTRWDGAEQGSLWTINVDGTNERVIISDLRKAKGPDWSPDGSQIVFNYQHGGRLEIKEECYNLLKGEPPMPPFNAYGIRSKFDEEFTPYLCWALPPDPHWGLRVVNLTDGNSEDVDGGTYAFRPTWDPGQPWRIVSDGGGGLLGIDINRPEYRQNLSDNVNDGSPVFSPDARYLAVTAGNQGGGAGYDIYRLNADGSGRMRLTQTPLWVSVGPDEQKPWNNVAPAWSPDGSQIAFLTDRTGRWEIWVMGADGSNQRPMFSETVNDQLDITYNFVDERVLSWR
jgi:uncharacterized protein YgiM (DUF1202 family)